VVDSADDIELIDIAPEALEQNLQLARDLGAEVHESGGEDIAEAIARFATETQATQIIVGHSQRSRWHELVHGSPIQSLLRRLPDLDIHVVAEPPEKAEAS
jgi:two-component system sensor histidine kinase KdpD